MVTFNYTDCEFSNRPKLTIYFINNKYAGWGRCSCKRCKHPAEWKATTELINKYKTQPYEQLKNSET